MCYAICCMGQVVANPFRPNTLCHGRTHLASLIVTCKKAPRVLLFFYSVFFSLSSFCSVITRLLFLLSFFLFLSFSYVFFPLVIPFVVSFSLFIFAFQLHSFLNSFRKLYNLLLVSYFSLIYLFNFSYILQVDIIIYFIIHIIHFYFYNNFDIPNRLFGYGNLAIPSIHEIAFEIKIVVSS